VRLNLSTRMFHQRYNYKRVSLLYVSVISAVTLMVGILNIRDFKVNLKNGLTSVLNLAPRLEDACVSGGIIPRILNIGTRWRRVASFTLRSLCPRGNSPKYESDRRLSWAPGPVWARLSKISFPCPCQESKTYRLAHSLVTILTELFRNHCYTNI